jgi:hypothetical protein
MHFSHYWLHQENEMHKNKDTGFPLADDPEKRIALAGMTV